MRYLKIRYKKIAILRDEEYICILPHEGTNIHKGRREKKTFKIYMRWVRTQRKGVNFLSHNYAERVDRMCDDGIAVVKILKYVRSSYL